MDLLFTPSGFFAFFVFLGAVAAFALAIHFFVSSRRRLVELFPDLTSAKQLSISGIGSFGLPLPAKKPTISSALQRKQLPAIAEANKAEMKNLPQRLNDTGQKPVSMQQKPRKEWLTQPEKQNLECERPHQAEPITETLQTQFDEMQENFNLLQEKLRRLGEETKQASNLSTQLLQSEEAQLALEESLLKKEERLQELMEENEQLHELLSDLQEKSAQSILQRQQLLKKIKFLEEINADLQQSSEADRKLRAKTTRIAELESMIEMMAGRG